jgi:hypothetical protein
MKRKFKVTESFASLTISAAAGEVLELTAEEAKSFAPFIEPFDEQAIETADLQPQAETADVKPPRRKKG